jgi:hypothetical protein
LVILTSLRLDLFFGIFHRDENRDRVSTNGFQDGGVVVKRARERGRDESGAVTPYLSAAHRVTHSRNNSSTWERTRVEAVNLGGLTWRNAPSHIKDGGESAEPS